MSRRGKAGLALAVFALAGGILAWRLWLGPKRVESAAAARQAEILASMPETEPAPGPEPDAPPEGSARSPRQVPGVPGR
jgi:hypothetical protein